jgi:hypothetical protein
MDLPTTPDLLRLVVRQTWCTISYLSASVKTHGFEVRGALVLSGPEAMSIVLVSIACRSAPKGTLAANTLDIQCCQEHRQIACIILGRSIMTPVLRQQNWHRMRDLVRILPGHALAGTYGPSLIHPIRM